MELPLYVAYVIPVLIFGSIYFLYYKKNESLPPSIKLPILGGLGWAILAIVALLPFLLILESSSEKRFLEIFEGDNHRSILFWFLFLFSVGSEIIRYKIVKTEKKWIGNYRSMIILGTYWGIFEFLTRFTFFFKDNSANVYSILFLFVYIILLNQGLSIIILRTEENTKFVLFATMMRFFAELAIFGAYGHIYTESERIARLSYVIGLYLIIVFLSVKTRKPVVETSVTHSVTK